MSRAHFEQILDEMVGLLPRERRRFRHSRTARNLKVWYGDAREHFEAQIVRRARGIRGPVLEIGFHAEHPEFLRNEAVIGDLLAREEGWRPVLGEEAEAAAFIGRPSWRRLSEIWPGEEEALLAPEAASEAAERLACYIRALQPILDERTDRPASRARLR